jgi:hypothetical protein
LKESQQKVQWKFLFSCFFPWLAAILGAPVRFDTLDLTRSLPRSSAEPADEFEPPVDRLVALP